MGLTPGGDLVTGGVDSLLNVWRDVTEREEEEKASALEQQVLQDQELANLVRGRHYMKVFFFYFFLSLSLALSLSRGNKIIINKKNAGSGYGFADRETPSAP